MHGVHKNPLVQEITLREIPQIMMEISTKVVTFLTSLSSTTHNKCCYTIMRVSAVSTQPNSMMLKSVLFLLWIKNNAMRY
jgi:hypothetical protein